MKTLFYIHDVEDTNNNKNVYFDLDEDNTIFVYRGDDKKFIGRYPNIGEAITDVLRKKYRGIPCFELQFIWLNNHFIVEKRRYK